MTGEAVLFRLRAHERDLRSAGIERLSLFGSFVRGEENANSDVDLLATFDSSRQLTLLDVVGIELRLTSLLGMKVELSEEGALKSRVQQSVELEAVRAF